MAPPNAPPANPSPKHKIAIIQLYPKPMNHSHNFSKAAQFIRSAAQQGAQLAVLPEYHLLNWLPNDGKFARRCAATWRHYLREYRRLARECGICIVPGTLVKTTSRRRRVAGSQLQEQGPDTTSDDDDGEDEKETDPSTTHPLLIEDESTVPQDAIKLENAAYFISPTGAILHKYVKKNLWGPTERAHLTSSGREAHRCFDTPLGRVGMLICWDLAFPEAFRELIAQGAKIIVLPTFWTLSDASDAGLRHNPSAEAVLVNSMATTRAFENTCAVILSNSGGPPGRNYLGLSQMTVPFVGPVAQLGSCAEGMIVADLNMGIVEDGEDNYQIRSDLASDGWHYDYRHDKDDWVGGAGGDGDGVSSATKVKSKL